MPADALPAGRRGPIEYMLARIEDGAPITGPLDPALSLIGQRMIDSAVHVCREQAHGPAGAMKQPRAAPKPSRRARRRRNRPATAAGRHSDMPSRDTYEELRAVLSSGTIHFPKRLRQVAIFLWQHPGDVALGTIVQVAEQAGVQPSTLVRFAQIFGYAGFSDFQGLFKEHVKGPGPTAAGGRPREPRGKQCQSAFHQRLDRGVARPRSAASARVSISAASSG